MSSALELPPLGAGCSGAGVGSGCGAGVGSGVAVTVGCAVSTFTANLNFIKVYKLIFIH